jgi:hypothetical protein
MDFSQFNGAEQAQMTRLIEKKQVCQLPPPSYGLAGQVDRHRSLLIEGYPQDFHVNDLGQSS